MGNQLWIWITHIVSYILFKTVESTFAISGRVSHMIAGWIPNILYAFIAFYLYQKAPK